MNKDTQSWSNSNLTEMEELLQKVQQLETENAALHRLIDDPNAMHSHYLRKCNGWEVWQAERIHWFQETVDKLERENAALRNELASLKHQTQWKCSCGGTDCEGQKENAALRSLLREAITEHVDPYDLPEGDQYIARAKAVLGIPPTQEAVTAARKEDKPSA